MDQTLRSKAQIKTLGNQNCYPVVLQTIERNLRKIIYFFQQLWWTWHGLTFSKFGARFYSVPAWASVWWVARFNFHSSAKDQPGVLRTHREMTRPEPTQSLVPVIVLANLPDSHQGLQVLIGLVRVDVVQGTAVPGVPVGGREVYSDLEEKTGEWVDLKWMHIRGIVISCRGTWPVMEKKVACYIPCQWELEKKIN